MSTVLETNKLSKRYRRTWALQDCTLSLPARRVAALVGPNGAGKTTLLHLAAGLLEPTKGSVQVFGLSPSLQPGEALPRLGFVAQDTPLYKGFKVEELLTLGRKLNPHWDDGLAQARMQKLGIPLNRRAGKLVADKTIEELTRGQGEFAVRLERTLEALVLLQQQPWGKHARLDDAGTLLTPAPQESGRDLYAFLTQADFPPESLAPATQNLEEVFFSLINAHEGDKEQ
jgi:ABC-type cobalamin/Fe3+-siderophores transport system ATPase subunit